VLRAERGIPGTTAFHTIAGGVGSLKGRTITYIPILLAAPSFTPTIAGLRAATAKVGMTLSVCDGGANPSAVTACVDQAIKERSAAVVTDAIPVNFAAPAFAALTKASIPLVYGDETILPTTKLQGNVGGNAGIEFASEGADWIIDTSGGEAHTLLLDVTDSSASVTDFEQGSYHEIKTKCPGCTIKVIKISSEQLQQLPSLVSSAFVQDPTINAVDALFDNEVSGVISGLQTADKPRVRIVGGTGVLQVLQAVAAGKVGADASYSAYQEGWLDLDQAMRMATGHSALDNEMPTLRLIDSTNIKSLKLTVGASNSNAWFGNNDFEEVMEKAWGVD
jgi:ribose transport system substrate-binding protein